MVKVNWENKLLFFGILFGTSFSWGQAPSVQWEKKMGSSNLDYGHSIVQTSDGGYVFVAEVFGGDGDVMDYHPNPNCSTCGDAWIVKVDGTGAIQWQKTIGGTGTDRVNSIALSADGGIVVAGDTTSHDGDFADNSNSGITGWVAKFSSAGTLQWRNLYAGNAGYSGINDIRLTSDNGFVFAGLGNDPNKGNGEYWVVKINSIGEVEWDKKYGGMGAEQATSVVQTTDGNYYVAGYSGSTNGDITNPHGSYDMWVLKLNAQGNIIWQKSFGGSKSDHARQIQLTDDGGFIMAGSTESSDGDVTHNNGSYGNDMWVVKVNSEGAIQWQKSYGSSANDEAWTIAKTADGGYVLGGNHGESDGDAAGNAYGTAYWVVKINAQGDLIWQKAYGFFNDTVYALIQTTDGGYMAFGDSPSDIYLMKLNAEGMGVNDVSKNLLKVYPNPSSGIVNFDEKLNSIRVYDLSGKLVYQFHEASLSLNLSHLSSGTYILRAMTHSKKQVETKIILK